MSRQRRQWIDARWSRSNLKIIGVFAEKSKVRLSSIVLFQRIFTYGWILGFLNPVNVNALVASSEKIDLVQSEPKVWTANLPEYSLPESETAVTVIRKFRFSLKAPVTVHLAQFGRAKPNSSYGIINQDPNINAEKMVTLILDSRADSIRITVIHAGKDWVPSTVIEAKLLIELIDNDTKAPIPLDEQAKVLDKIRLEEKQSRADKTVKDIEDELFENPRACPNLKGKMIDIGYYLSQKHPKKKQPEVTALVSHVGKKIIFCGRVRDLSIIEMSGGIESDLRFYFDQGKVRDYYDRNSTGYFERKNYQNKYLEWTEGKSKLNPKKKSKLLSKEVYESYSVYLSPLPNFKNAFFIWSHHSDALGVVLILDD